MLTATLYVMGNGNGGASVQKDFQDFVIVSMGGQDQGSYIWGEHGRVDVHFLPTLGNEMGNGNFFSDLNRTKRSKYNREQKEPILVQGIDKCSTRDKSLHSHLSLD